MRSLRMAGATTVVTLALGSMAFAQPPGMGGTGAQMPDARQMSGVPLPVGDVPTGTVTVRVVRGAMTNPLKGETVTLTGAASPQTATTDDAGRATFSGLAIGAHVKASTTVNGEALASQEFDVPAQGGVRVALVATDPELQKKLEQDRQLAQGPAIDGTVVLGDQSRFVVELGDDGLNVFNMFEVVNTARRPVKTAAPLVFEVPADATGLGVLEESSKNAVAEKQRISVSGPFAPGVTSVQFAYTLPVGSDSITISQKLPVQMTQFAVMVQTVAGMQVESAQMAQHRQVTGDSGTFIVGQGPAIKAGDTVRMTITGVPHAPTWPRNVALALAGVILIGGAWAARRPTTADSTRRRKLQDTRERLLSELTSLEQQRRRGDLDDTRYAQRRRELVTSLEGVYAQLDGEAAA